MQDFTLALGKTKDELLQLTEETDLGSTIYNPKIKAFYQKNWQTITPNSVIKPEIDGEELDYYYKDTKLTKNTKYCAQLYWKAGGILQTGESSDLFTTALGTQDYPSGGNFNADSGLVDTVFYTAGMLQSGRLYNQGFAIASTLGAFLDTSEILSTLKKVPGLNRSTPTLDYDFCYYGEKASNLTDKKLGLIWHNTDDIGYYPPTSYLFGHALGYDRTGVPKIKVTDGSNDDKNIVMTYSQPENNSDDSNFYNFANGSSTSSFFTSFPQALPIGVPMVIAPSFITSNTNISANYKTLVAPFIFYMLGITETPEVAKDV